MLRSKKVPENLIARLHIRQVQIRDDVAHPGERMVCQGVPK